MRYFGKGLATKCYFVQVVLCVVCITGGAAWAADTKDAYYYFRVGDWPKAAASYAASAREKSSVEDLNRAAEASYHLGSLDEAEDFAGMAIKIADTAGSRATLCLIRAKKGRRDEAVNELETMLKEYPDDYRILTALGVIMAGENTETALSYLSKAVDKNPDYFPAWFNIGLIYEDSEMFEKASKAYRNAVQANHLSAQAHNNLGYSYKEQHFYEYAVEEYLRAIALMPDNAGYYYNIGNAYAYQEKIEDAFQAYKKALELDPTFAKAHYNMARTYLRKNMVKEAIDEFNLYLKYGNRAVFSYVAPESAVEDEIEQLEYYLKYDLPQRHATGRMAR